MARLQKKTGNPAKMDKKAREHEKAAKQLQVKAARQSKAQEEVLPPPKIRSQIIAILIGFGLTLSTAPITGCVVSTPNGATTPASGSTTTAMATAATSKDDILKIRAEAKGDTTLKAGGVGKVKFTLPAVAFKDIESRQITVTSDHDSSFKKVSPKAYDGAALEYEVSVQFPKEGSFTVTGLAKVGKRIDGMSAEERQDSVTFTVEAAPAATPTATPTPVPTATPGQVCAQVITFGKNVSDSSAPLGQIREFPNSCLPAGWSATSAPTANSGTPVSSSSPAATPTSTPTSAQPASTSTPAPTASTALSVSNGTINVENMGESSIVSVAGGYTSPAQVFADLQNGTVKPAFVHWSAPGEQGSFSGGRLTVNVPASGSGEGNIAFTKGSTIVGWFLNTSASGYEAAYTGTLIKYSSGKVTK